MSQPKAAVRLDFQKRKPFDGLKKIRHTHYSHTHSHTHTHILTHVHTHTLLTHTHILTHTYSHMCTHTHILTHSHTYIHTPHTHMRNVKGVRTSRTHKRLVLAKMKKRYKKSDFLPAWACHSSDTSRAKLHVPRAVLAELLLAPGKTCRERPEGTSWRRTARGSSGEHWWF